MGCHISEKINNVVSGSHIPKPWKTPATPPPYPLPPPRKFHSTKISCLNFWQLPVSNRPAIAKISERRGQPREVYPALRSPFGNSTTQFSCLLGTFVGNFRTICHPCSVEKRKEIGNTGSVAGHTGKPIWTFGASMCERRLKWRAMGNTRGGEQ